MFCLNMNVIIFALSKHRLILDERIQIELAAGTNLLIPGIILFEPRYGKVPMCICSHVESLQARSRTWADCHRLGIVASIQLR